MPMQCDVNETAGNRILTLPNLLSFFRLGLFPWILVCLSDPEKWRLCGGLLLLSGLTDVADGYIARHLHQETELGRVLDPFADKLTEGGVLFGLCVTHPAVFPLALLFCIKEFAAGLAGLHFAHKTRRFVNARWFGKVNTATLYATMLALLFVPELPLPLYVGLLTLASGTVLFSGVAYISFFAGEDLPLSSPVPDKTKPDTLM